LALKVPTFVKDSQVSTTTLELAWESLYPEEDLLNFKRHISQAVALSLTMFIFELAVKVWAEMTVPLPSWPIVSRVLVPHPSQPEWFLQIPRL
jgi:hypothetical protein